VVATWLLQDHVLLNVLGEHTFHQLLKLKAAVTVDGVCIRMGCALWMLCWTVCSNFLLAWQSFRILLLQG
jgi:hypothetical protein